MESKPSLPPQKGMRLDVYLAAAFEVSRSRAAQWIEAGYVQVNGKKPTKAGFKLETLDEVVASIPPPVPSQAQPQAIPVKIIYEDDWLAVVDKPRGMVVHPAAGNADGTMVNALLYWLDGLSGIGGEVRPGIVHRLDKDTSGLMMVAKTDEAHAALSAALKERTIHKRYLALVIGSPKVDEGLIDEPIGRHPVKRKQMAVVSNGRFAQTCFQVLERYGGRSLLLCTLITGRTHQIRVHLTHMGFPIVGDPVYGKAGGKGQMLHAASLAFSHPRDGGPLSFFAPPPEDMLNAIEASRRKVGHAPLDEEGLSALIKAMCDAQEERGEP